jgi:hypothetical protein
MRELRYSAPDLRSCCPTLATRRAATDSRDGDTSVERPIRSRPVQHSPSKPLRCALMVCIAADAIALQHRIELAPMTLCRL